jgi:hypothetical protein
MTAARLAQLQAMSYEAYLQTPEWRRTRNQALSRAGWQCEWPRCATRDNLKVHHRNYEHLGAERDEDVRVLCSAHQLGQHERANRFERLHWRVIRDVINSGSFECLSDFVDAVKSRLSKMRIPYDATLNDILRMALRDVPMDVPTHLTRVDVHEDPAPINEAGARAVLDALGIGSMIRCMPRVVRLSAFQVDQLTALRVVYDDLETSMARCAALEAHVYDGNGHERGGQDE